MRKTGRAIVLGLCTLAASGLLVGRAAASDELTVTLGKSPTGAIKVGDSLTVTANVTDSGSGVPVSGATVSFALTGANVGTAGTTNPATTGVTGDASWTYSGANVGSDTIQASASYMVPPLGPTWTGQGSTTATWIEYDVTGITAAAQTDNYADYGWTVTKDGTPDKSVVQKGSSATVNYSIDPDVGSIGFPSSSYTVAGNITVNNLLSVSKHVDIWLHLEGSSNGTSGWTSVFLTQPLSLTDVTLAPGSQVIPYTSSWSPGVYSYHRITAIIKDRPSTGTSPAAGQSAPSSAFQFSSTVNDHFTGTTADLADDLTCPPGFTCGAPSPALPTSIDNGNPINYTRTITNNSVSCGHIRDVDNTVTLTPTDNSSQAAQTDGVSLQLSTGSCFQTTITSGPRGFVLKKAARFTFKADHPNAFFGCGLDGHLPLQQCGSPKSYPGLHPGDHQFAVDSENAQGYDPTPAIRKWNIPFDDRALTRHGSWTLRKGTPYYGGTISESTAHGASLTFNVTGVRHMALVATKCPSCGKVDVFLGTTLLKHLDLHASALKNKAIIPAGAFTSPRTGTVRLVVATAGKTVDIDGLGASKV